MEENKSPAAGAHTPDGKPSLNRGNQITSAHPGVRDTKNSGTRFPALAAQSEIDTKRADNTFYIIIFIEVYMKAVL